MSNNKKKKKKNINKYKKNNVIKLNQQKNIKKDNNKETKKNISNIQSIIIQDMNNDKADKVKEIFLNTVEYKKSKPIKTIFISIIITLLLISLSYSIFLNITLYNKTNTVYKYKNDENIVFYGDSITSKYEIENFFPKNKIINSGRSGDIASDLVERIEEDVYKYNPSKVFILIGINDLTRNVDKDEILNNIQEIITGIKIHRKYSKIYIESIYPINKEYMKEKEYSKEGLHLNDVGYLKVSNVLNKYIKEK